MSATHPCRVLTDPPAAGAWNMAVDEALAASVAEGGIAVLRFYTWSEATLSLGYFQRVADRQLHPPSRTCALTRRLSGGGAILHHLELTYSICLPPTHRLARHREQLYQAVHTSFVETLSGFNVSAGLYSLPQTDKPSKVGARPFLCFERRAEGDVMIDKYKVAGSAQRRPRNVVLQHGSVLLSRSEFAPELPGIRELAGMSVRSDELSAAWLARLAERLRLNLQPGQLTEGDHRLATELVQTKYADPNWIARP